MLKSGAAFELENNTETLMRVGSTGVSIGSATLSAGLELDVEGKVGATEYCDNTGANCFNPASVSIGGAVSGSGTTNYLAKFTHATAIGNSLLYENGPVVAIGTTTPQTNVRLEVNTPLENYGFNHRAGTIGLATFVGGTTAGGWLGTTTAHPLHLMTNAATRFLIDTTGRVGIGDSTPDHKLDVAGNLGLDASSYINFGDIDGTTGYGLRDSAGTIQLKNSAGSWSPVAAESDLGSNTYTLTRAMPAAVNGSIDLGSFALTTAAGALHVSIVVPGSGFSQSKIYDIPVAYNETAGLWETALPVADSGPF